MNVQTFASKPSFAINSAHICAGIVMASLILFVHIETHTPVQMVYVSWFGNKFWKKCLFTFFTRV